MKRRKNEKKMVTAIKKLLPDLIVLNPKIKTPTLSVRDNIFVDYHIMLNGKELMFEYNGPHHYQPYSYSNETLVESTHNFKEQVKRDNWLREYCRLNKIILIEIDGRLISGDNVKLYLLQEFIKLGFIKRR